MGKHSHPVIIPAVRPPLPRESRWARDLPPAAADPDLTLDFTDEAPAAGRRLTATFDGGAGEDALIAALIAGGAPLVRLVAESGAVVVEMRPALEAARTWVPTWSPPAEPPSTPPSTASCGSRKTATTRTASPSCWNPF